LQGRCLYYFKKETGTDPPNGNIPLVDIEVNELPPKKGNKYMFSITLTKNPTIAKRAEYLINADSDDIRKRWINIIHENKAVSIVGQPLKMSTEVSPNSNNVHLLMPYFMTQTFKILDSTGYKLKNIWTSEVPHEIIIKGLATLDMNHSLHTEDIHNTLAIIIEYLKKLPEGLLPSSALNKFASKVTPEELREVVRGLPAPVRSVLREISLNLKKVIDNTATNGVTIAALSFVIGPFIIHPGEGSSMVQSQMKNIQEQISSCLIQHAQKIFEDVHQFLDAPRQNVIRCARVINTTMKDHDDLIEATHGLLVYVVREDSYGWCTVYTSNRRVGLIHTSNLKALSAEEEKELSSGPNIDALMDVVRECCPELMLVFDGMNEEISRLRDSFDALK
jgi:hypothetical protein